MSIPFTWVYLIYDPFTDYYKIGKSDAPETRLKQLCNPSSYGTIPAAPTNYQLLEAWLCPEQTEAELHEYFASVRERGEWFELSRFFDIPARESYEITHRVSGLQMLKFRERLYTGGFFALEIAEWELWRVRESIPRTSLLLYLLDRAKSQGVEPLKEPLIGRLAADVSEDPIASASEGGDVLNETSIGDCEAIN